MTTAYTSLLGLALPVTGELSGTWGDTVNNAITSLLDSAVAGTTTLSTDADVTLTTTSGAANQAREAILLCSGSRTALRTITAPAQSKIYAIINSTTGGYSVKLVGAGPTTGVTIVANESAIVAWNGSDFIKIASTVGVSSITFGSTGLTPSTATSGAVTVAGTLATTNGGTNLTSFTSGGAVYATSTSALTTGTLPATAGGTGQSSAFTQYGVAYASTTTALTTGSALTFDGTNFGVLAGSVTTPAAKIHAVGSVRSSNGAGTIYTSLSSDGVYSTGTDLYLFAPTGYANIFYANNAEQMRLTSTGLGIGTTSPGAKLAVVGTGYSPNITLTDAATIAWNTASGQVATFTFVSSNRTMGAPTNLVNGAFYALAVIQNSGSNTLTWNSVFKWANGAAPTLSTAASAKDYFVFRSDGTNLYEQGRSQGVA